MPWRTHVHELGFLAVVVALAGLLVGTSLSSYRGDRALTWALVAGEGERLFHRLRELPRPESAQAGPPRPEQLVAGQAALAAEGLLRVAVIGPGAEVLAESGPAGPEGDALVTGVARLERPLHPPRPQHPPRGDAPPPGDGVLPRLLLEYEPRLALDLQHRARRDLIASLAVAAALLIAGWVFYRLRRRAQLAEEGLAERRHLAALGELSAVLAHEIRNPLASLKGHAQLLEEQLADDPRRHAKAHRVVDEAVRLEHLTNSLLDFTRADRLATGVASPAEVARRAAELTDPARVVVDVAGAPERWSFDAMRIEQALVNLLRNALQASAPPAEVELKVVDDGDGLRFTVADRGPGVPSEMRPRLFEPFVTGRAEGTGLGLAVVRRVVELHGGKVTIERRHGGGSVFVLWLPPGPQEAK
ncbi:HAMP domain-containing sensor histidine kinase [Nannocystis sp.]|uniref:sensor histidine kinase n=1 Tax=Nannocystis sp. TaxID=1962667 RepID=UPI002600D36C|nr:HAMP domain-containing sensor histidine kinase [Nannocystis sp.]MBK7827107.1 HAMP domain-containing histidine kinase [Nannocystis sp.]